MIKTLLMFKHQAIPAQVNYQEQNPYIELENTPFYISNEKQDWTRENNEYPRRAGISSFGFGGAMHM